MTLARGVPLSAWWPDLAVVARAAQSAGQLARRLEAAKGFAALMSLWSGAPFG